MIIKWLGSRLSFIPILFDILVSGFRKGGVNGNLREGSCIMYCLLFDGRSGVLTKACRVGRDTFLVSYDTLIMNIYDAILPYVFRITRLQGLFHCIARFRTLVIRDRYSCVSHIDPWTDYYEL